MIIVRPLGAEAESGLAHSGPVQFPAGRIGANREEFA